MLDADVGALAALPDDALSGEFGRHSYDALELAATVCTAAAAEHLLTREAYVRSLSIYSYQDRHNHRETVLERAAVRAKDRECTLVLQLLLAAGGGDVVVASG